MKPWTPQKYGSIRALVYAYERGDRPRLFFTEHCGARFKEMGVTDDEVFDCISKPEAIGISARHEGMTLKAGRIALGVVLDDETGFPLVATILWRYQDGWREAAASGRLGKGRALYDDMSHLPVGPAAV